MRGKLIWIAPILLLLVLQTPSFQFLEIRHIKPDFFLLAVLMIGMRKGYTAGTFWGMGLGFIQDIYSGGILGFNFLTKGVTGYSVGQLCNRLDFDNPNTQVVVTLLATLAEGLVYSIIVQAFYPPKEILVSFYRAVFPVAVYNSLLIPLWPLVSQGAERYFRRRWRSSTGITG